MLRYFKKIIWKIVRLQDYIPDLKTRIILLIIPYPKVKINGKGRFNQEVVFWGKGEVYISDGYSFGYRYGGGYHGALCEIQVRTKEAVINIGRNIATNNGVFICSAGRIEIGDDCLIGQDVLIIDHDAHGIDPKERRTSIGNVKPIVIGNNVWIGSKVIILPGTKIGDNCIVGAGAIVKGCFPSNVIIAGNPAKIVKNLTDLGYQHEYIY